MDTEQSREVLAYHNKLLTYLREQAGADLDVLKHVQRTWRTEVVPRPLYVRQKNKQDAYYTGSAQPGAPVVCYNSMIGVARGLGLRVQAAEMRPAKKMRMTDHDDDDGFDSSDEQPQQPTSSWPSPQVAIARSNSIAADKPKRQTTLPKRLSEDVVGVEHSAMRQVSLHELSRQPSSDLLQTPQPLHATQQIIDMLQQQFREQQQRLTQDLQAHRPLSTPRATMKHEAPPKIQPPVLLELEPAESATVLGTHEAPSSAAAAATSTSASVPQAGTAVEWVASFILHAHGSRVQLLDRSGLVLACQHALPLQYVVEEGSGPNRVCLRILPLLDEEPEERWASLDVATAADQLGTVFDGGPRFTGAAVTALLNEQHRQQLCMGDGEDEWALLDLRLPQMSSRVVSTHPQGVLRMEESQLLPAFLSSPQQPVHLQLQPQHHGPGVLHLLPQPRPADTSPFARFPPFSSDTSSISQQSMAADPHLLGISSASSFQTTEMRAVTGNWSLTVPCTAPALLYDLMPVRMLDV